MPPLLKNSTFRIICLFTVLLTVAFYDVVLLGKTFKVSTANSQALPTGAYGQENNKPSFIPVNGTDAPVLEEPVYHFIKTWLKRGVIPLWNPHQAAGYPLIGMLQVGMFSPVNFVMYVFPEFFSWDILILLRFLLAGLFTFWLMRSLGFKTVPSLGAGICFMLSGPMVLMQYWTVNVDVFVPVLLIAIDRVVRQATRRSMGFLAVVVLLTVLGGHPEHIFLVNVYGTAFFAFRLWSLRKRIPVTKCLGLFAGAYALGIALSAFVLFPFFRNLLFEFWHGHPQGVGLRMEEQAGRALTLALPFFFQDVPLTYQWQFSGWWGGYLGAVPLALAFLSLFGKHKRGLNYFFGVMAFLIVGKQYGLPVINWIGYLPLFSVVRYAIHAPHLAAFSVAVLAGMGIRTVQIHKRTFAKGLIFTLGLLAVAGLHLIFVKNPDNPGSGIKAFLTALTALAALQAVLFLRDRRLFSRNVIGLLLLFVLFGELFVHIHRERPRRFASFGNVPYIEFLRSAPDVSRAYGNFWAFYPNTASGFGVDDLGYFFGLVPKRFVTFVNTLVIPNHFRNDLRPPALRAIPVQNRDFLLDLLNVRYLVTPKTNRFSRRFGHFSKIGDTHPLVYDKEVKIYERPDVFPRAFIVHRAFFIPEETLNLELINRIGPQLRHVAVIDAAPIPQIIAALRTAPAQDDSSVKITKYTPNEVVLRAGMKSPGFVILSDAYHPDWTLTVNGQERAIFPADYLLRGVFLPAGDFELRFVFRPLSLYLGIMISVFALLILLAMIIPRNPGKKIK